MVNRVSIRDARGSGALRRGAVHTVGRWHSERVVLGTGAGAGGLLGWQNPLLVAVLVRIELNLTAASGAAATADFGTAANATTSSDNLVDGLSINQTGAFDNIEDRGTNGKSRQRVDAKGGTTDFVTGSIATGSVGSLVGTVIVHFIELD